MGLDGAGDDGAPRPAPGGSDPAAGAPPPGAGTAAAQRFTTWLRGIRPRRADLKADALAGLPGAISSVPDGMATAVLVGVNPAYGLYASFAGKIGGGLTTSTTMMVVTTTTAASLAAGSALEDFATDERAGALVLLTMLTGAVMIAAGILRLGRYIRFVSRSVMLGFLTGVSVNIVFGQLPDLLGVDAGGGVASQKAWYILTHPGEINWAAAAVGISALLLLFGLARTRFALFGSLVAVVVPTAIVAFLGNTSVATVSDEGSIPTGLPPLALPHFSDLNVGVISGALAIAAIALVQGAGVAESAPNPDGSPSHTNGDFIGQGVGNLASGLFHGTPVGGSVGSTALNVSAGARSRWSSVFAGLWMLVILVALSGLVGAVAMPTLGAVLIFAAVKSLRPGEIAVVWKTAHTGKIALVVTFVATLALPVAAAVAVGVVCSLLLQLNKGLMDLRVVQLEPTGDGRLMEHPPPATLPDDRPVVLDVYGSLLYAGARTLGTKLPDPRGAHHPVVVLRLRGRTSLGSTFFGVIAGYAELLAASGGRLYLSGVEPEMVAQFHHAQVKDNAGTMKVFQATEVLGESTIEAVADARSWLVGQGSDPV